MQNSLGIDIKDNSVAIVFLKTSLKGIKLGAHEIYAFEKDKPLNEKMGIVRDLAAEFMRENRVSPTNIFVGIPAGLTIFRDIEFPLAVKENLRSVLRYEMEKYVPIPADDVLFDFQILSEDKGKNRLKVLLFVAKKSAVSSYLELPNIMTGGISGIEPVSAAIANFVSYKQGLPGSDKKLIDFLKGENIDLSPVELSEAGIPSPDLVPAFGLALKGLWKKVPLQINLVPFELRKKPGKAGYYIMIAAAVAALLAGVAWGGSHVIKQRLRLKELNTEISRLGSDVKNISRIKDSFKELEDRTGYLNSLRQDNISALDVLRELTQLIPETAWIQDLDFSEKRIQINGYAESASELIPLLEGSPLFKEAGFLSPITKKDGKERFRIEFKREGNEVRND
ncbi:MAG: pilus assembly protein PilM [Desulfobacterales bacterium]|nr:pilus assembly protein PilM [Desulfobacterales bacterium]